MDPWKEYAAWESGRHVARRWAELEGKSATMREDLYRGRNAHRTVPWETLGAWAHFGVWIAEVWRYFRSM